MRPEPGWLNKALHESMVDAATWPSWLRDSSDDAELSPAQRKEAAARLRARADELDPPELRSLFGLY